MTERADDRFSVLLKQRPIQRVKPDLVLDVERVPMQIRSAFRGCCDGKLPWPLLLLGDPGIGKTRFCYLAQDWFSGRYEDLADWADEYRAVRCGDFYDPRCRNSVKMYERHWVKWVYQERIVYVDDIGRRERESDHVKDTLMRILNCREGGRPMVLVSNLPVDDIGKTYDERIASRMMAGTVVDVEDAPDQRRAGSVKQ